jgi:hypothetical protein
MSTSERPACVALGEYMVEDDHLFDKIRMNFEWDERAFQRLVQVSTRCLEEIEHDDMIPRYVASFFGNWLHIMMGMMQHPNFLKLNREGRTTEGTEAYFRDCIEIMKKLVRWMSNGPRPYPPAHFIRPGWESSITETPDITAPTLTRPRDTTPTHASERSACAALREYMHGDGRFFEQPSVSLEWDDQAFQALVQIATKCLEEIEHDDMIPRYVASFFGDWLQDLEHTMLDPRFLRQNSAGRTEQDTKTYFSTRSGLLGSLIFWMAQGMRQQPLERFILSEWRVNPASEGSTDAAEGEP